MPLRAGCCLCIGAPSDEAQPALYCSRKCSMRFSACVLEHSSLMAPSNCCFSTKSRAQQQAAPHCICSTLHTTRSTAASHALLAGILFLSGWHMRMILELPTHISSITHSTRSHRAQNWPLTQAHRATSACACLLVRVYARKSGVRVALTTTFQNTFGSLLFLCAKGKGGRARLSLVPVPA